MDDQNVQIFKDFKTRRMRQLALTVAVFLGVFIFIFFEFAAGAFAVVGVVAVLSLLNWRCPACKRYLGRTSMNPAFCHRCGARLRPS